MPSEKEIEAAARAVFVAWRTHVLTQRGIDRRRVAKDFESLDESERTFALSNARAALVAAVIAELTPDERAKVEARALELISQQTTLCRNCKAPIDDGHKEFCGMCREMGCS